MKKQKQKKKNTKKKVKKKKKKQRHPLEQLTELPEHGYKEEFRITRAS